MKPVSLPSPFRVYLGDRLLFTTPSEKTAHAYLKYFLLNHPGNELLLVDQTEEVSLWVHTIDEGLEGIECVLTDENLTELLTRLTPTDRKNR